MPAYLQNLRSVYIPPGMVGVVGMAGAVGADVGLVTIVSGMVKLESEEVITSVSGIEKLESEEAVLVVVSVSGIEKLESEEVITSVSGIEKLESEEVITSVSGMMISSSAYDALRKTKTVASRMNARNNQTTMLFCFF